MLSSQSRLSLEPLFCKSTGAYRADVARFCQMDIPLTGTFKLTPSRKPSLLDHHTWPLELISRGDLKLAQGVNTLRGVRSVFQREQINVTSLINSSLGVVLELAHASADLIEDLGLQFGARFPSVAITLIRFGILETHPKFVSNVNATGLFQVENFVELLKSEEIILARNTLSGRTLNLTGNSFLVDLIQSGDIFKVDKENQAHFETLSQLGLFRQIAETE